MALRTEKLNVQLYYDGFTLYEYLAGEGETHEVIVDPANNYFGSLYGAHMMRRHDVISILAPLVDGDRCYRLYRVTAHTKELISVELIHSPPVKGASNVV